MSAPSSPAKPQGNEVFFSHPDDPDQKFHHHRRNRVFDQKESERARNPGHPFEPMWLVDVQVNRPALVRRANTHKKRRTVKKGTQLGWLLRAINCIDLTALSGDDTDANIKRLCHKAKQPLRRDLQEALNITDLNLTTGAVCVYPNRVRAAAKFLEGTGIPVASVAAGFPAGQTQMSTRLEEIRFAVAEGATEIDIVISRQFVIEGNWEALYDEVKQFVDACGDTAQLKAIIATGDLPTLRDVYKAGLVCCMAGADFIKTSTGKESTNACLVVSLVMMRTVRDYFERTGYKVGFKPAGGIRTAKDALSYLMLFYEELGDDWTYPHLCRLGASSLLTDIELQVDHGVTGFYSAAYYHPQP
jgi:deoxyribose-phosphate aldolase